MISKAQHSGPGLTEGVRPFPAFSPGLQEGEGRPRAARTQPAVPPPPPTGGSRAPTAPQQPLLWVHEVRTGPCARSCPACGGTPPGARPPAHPLLFLLPGEAASPSPSLCLSEELYCLPSGTFSTCRWPGEPCARLLAVLTAVRVEGGRESKEGARGCEETPRKTPRDFYSRRRSLWGCWGIMLSPPSGGHPPSGCRLSKALGEGALLEKPSRGFTDPQPPASLAGGSTPIARQDTLLEMEGVTLGLGHP